MKLLKGLTIDRVLMAVMEESNTGFCMECADEASGVEPDACEYLCENCGKQSVYGAEEILLTLV